MPQSTIFVQLQGDARVIELAVAEGVTESELHKALSKAGVLIDPELFVFIDEAEEPVSREGNRPTPSVVHGARIHISRCRRIKATVHFLEKTIEGEFPPGTRVRKIKQWATHEFRLDHKDAAEHVLQICSSTKRPASDTPLHTLVEGNECAICFDLVPEKRVEG
jgi:hypothetical protein